MRPTFYPHITAVAAQDPWYIGASSDGIGGPSRSMRSSRGCHIPSVLCNAFPHGTDRAFPSHQNCGDYSYTNLDSAAPNNQRAYSSMQLVSSENDVRVVESEDSRSVGQEFIHSSGSSHFTQPQSLTNPQTSAGCGYHSGDHRHNGEYSSARPNLSSRPYGSNSIGVKDAARQPGQILSTTSSSRPSTLSPRAHRCADFLDFLVCHLSLLADNDTEQIAQNVQDAFRQYLAENDSDISEYSEIVQDFKPRIGSDASRNERNKRQTHATTDRCPVRGCPSTFTRRNGLKNHIAAHFGLLPRTCEFCQTDLTVPSLRRHEKTCRARPPIS